MTKMLYHFSSTYHLPWIFESGELRPGQNSIAGFPNPDFLWATNEARGDGTCTAHRFYKSGRTWLVRFTADAEDFFPWKDITRKSSPWTIAQIARLETLAEGKSDPADWWCRADPLPLHRVISIEAKSFCASIWRTVEHNFEVIRVPGKRVLKTTIGNYVFSSSQETGPHGQKSYEIL
ncbi:hypothetical protein V5F53_02705 [Xanthobacter sp. V4C-4]|uniref:hypothetical protein n=1 Tax=Xanthobacter cornucopiae TaxID=3119924 RepID=UPI00372725C2